MIINIFLCTIFFVLMLLVFGYVYTLIREKSCRNIQETFGSNVFLLFSFIGTPIHELSHYIACKIFRHKVSKVVLFSPKEWKHSEQLGCVEHSYNPKNIYQQAGNFIIGIAPILGGCGISILIMNFYFNSISNFIPEKISSLKDISFIIKNIIFSILSIFKTNNIKSPLFWIILFILINIFLHVCLSKADFKNCLVGIIFFIIIIPLIAIFLNIGGITFETFYNLCIKINISFLFILLFGFVISIIIFLISYMSKIIKRLVER